MHAINNFLFEYIFLPSAMLAYGFFLAALIRSIVKDWLKAARKKKNTEKNQNRRRGEMNSRRKGKVGEREFAALLREHGFDARRGQQFSGSPDSVPTWSATRWRGCTSRSNACKI